MPVSKKHDFIFIHNPKCGGSAIEDYFGMGNKMNLADKNKLFGLERKNTLSDEAIKRERKKPVMERKGFSPHLTSYVRPLQHLTIAQIIDEKYIIEEAFRSKYSFAFVRNPWDKIVSSYVSHFHKHHPKFGDFIDWVASIVATENLGDIFIYKEKGSRVSNCHFTEQHRFVNYKDEQIVSFVGRYENFEEDLKMVCEAVKLPFTIPKVVNKTKNKEHYSTYYTDANRKLVEVLYKKDIELFGYKFETE